MKIKKGLVGLLALVGVFSLASCGNDQGTKTTTPAPTTTATTTDPSTTTTQAAPTFEAYTLETLHEARKAKTLQSLDKKTVVVKGKVTYAKRVNENNSAMFIQSGKYGLEVSYPAPYSVNVGDVVEVKGEFGSYPLGDIYVVTLYSDQSMNANYGIKVINEAITTETVTINSMADLIEYDSSLSTINFTVVGNRTNAAFIGKLTQGDDQIIVAPKASLAEKFDAGSFAEGESVTYSGVFTFGGDSSARVLRYFDKAGFAKK